MMSLRTAVRSAPRLASAIRTAATRPSSSSIFRPSTTLRLTRQPTSSFSTSLFRRGRSAGETDEELSAKLASEIEYENDVKENEPLPASIKDFLDNSAFEIHDTPGKEEVMLTRAFGNEKITIKFSISDLQNYDPDMFDEDSALGEEDIDGVPSKPSPSQQSSSSSNTPVDPEEEDADLDSPADAAVPCRLTIIVEKPTQPGALNIEATAQDGSIMVDNMYYFADKALAYGASGEAAHAAGQVYAGPPFGSLDEDLQILMERYLEERGVTQALAVFVPDYMDVKEQKEYLRWLEGLKGFIDA